MTSFNVTGNFTGRGNSTNEPVVQSSNTTGKPTNVRSVPVIPNGSLTAKEKRKLTRQKDRSHANDKKRVELNKATPRHKLTRAEIVDGIRKEQNQRIREEMKNEREKRIAPSGRVDTTISDGEHGVLAIQEMPTKTDSRDYLKYDDLRAVTAEHFKCYNSDVLNHDLSTAQKVVLVAADPNLHSEEVNNLIRTAARNNDVLLTDHDYVADCYIGSLRGRCVFATRNAVFSTVMRMGPEQLQQERTLYVVTDPDNAFPLGNYLRQEHRGFSFHFELLPGAQ